METFLSEIETGIRRATAWTIVVAIVAMLCGFLAIAAPIWGALVATYIFGAMAIVAGVFELAYAWRTRGDVGAVWRFVIGVAYLVAGIYVLAQPAAGMLALSLALGVLLAARGVSLVVLAIELRSTRVWGWYLVDGLISLALGALIVAAWPLRSVLYLGLYFGVSLVVAGVQRLSVAAWVRRSLPPTERRPPITAAHA